jgi:dienelactone hydrolase
VKLDWLGEPVTTRRVTERGFRVECDGRSVPGLVWTHEAPRAPQPLVLIGHGGSQDKRAPHILSLARRLVRHHGIAAAAIDGPIHGDRRPEGIETIEDLRAEFRRVWNRAGTTDEMVADWKTTLDALQKEIGGGRVGYWGLSMGTAFGLPFAAAEPRVSVAVLGLMGTFGPSAERLRRDAARIRCPVLFLQQWNDELIPREAVSDLFDALGTGDKRLHANPGAHAAVPPEEFGSTEAFLARHLV